MNDPFISVVRTDHPEVTLSAQVNPVFSYLGEIHSDLVEVTKTVTEGCYGNNSWVFQLVFYDDLAPLSLTSYTLTAKQRQPSVTSVASVYLNAELQQPVLPRYVPFLAV